MQVFKVGTPKTWDDPRNLSSTFVSAYNRVKDLKGDELLWGDEIEYGVFVLDHEQKKVRLSLRAKEVCAVCVRFV